jgi:hypothetical protein
LRGLSLQPLAHDQRRRMAGRRAAVACGKRGAAGRRSVLLRGNPNRRPPDQQFGATVTAPWPFRRYAVRTSIDRTVEKTRLKQANRVRVCSATRRPSRTTS